VIEPIRLSFDVACSREHAFETWTTRIGTWWPKSHSVTGDEHLEIVLEGRHGGRIFERTPSGIEHDWGEITLWEPPDRFGYLWHLQRDRADATDVEIRFISRDQATTTVEIEHRGWERLGADGQTWRDRNLGGWNGLLPHYRIAVERG
jgi:activator of Hsp90 ATPase-like protein